jgi:branched-chain amino acid transport system substrate-binding protein
MKGTFGRFAGAAAVAAFLAGPAHAGEVKLGLILSLSGPISSIGVPYEKGIKAWEAGNHDKIGGNTLKVIEIDDASNADAASRAAKKLVEEDHVDVLMGTAGTPGSLAIYSVAAEAHVPMLFTGNGSVPGPAGDWEITIPQPTPLMVSADIAYMKAHNIHRVAFIGFSDVWGDTVYNALLQTAKPAGIEVISNERYARPDTSVTPQILKIMALHPDAVLTGGSGSPGALPHLALAERGYTGPEFASHAVVNSEFVRVGGKAVEGVIAPTGPEVVAEQLPDSNPIKAVSMEYRKLFKEANGVEATDAFPCYAYDAFLLMADGIKRVAAKGIAPGTPEYRTALRDALVSTHELVGTQAVYDFTPGQRFGTDDRSRVLVQLEHGKWQLVQ